LYVVLFYFLDFFLGLKVESPWSRWLLLSRKPGHYHESKTK
jgi:hypothetical protein